METATTQTPAGHKRSPAMTAFLIVLAMFFVFIVAIFGFIAMQPATFTVTRSAKIAAPPAAVFDQVNDFHNWNDWSPWAKLDPNAKNTFEGPSAGEGAKFHWEGNSDIGEGGMTITESRPDELVLIKLEFIKPFASVCDTEFKFQPEGDQTEVTWTMSGQNNFLSKAIHLVMDMEQMVGESFEEGLANLKSVVEKSSQH